MPFNFGLSRVFVDLCLLHQEIHGFVKIPGPRLQVDVGDQAGGVEYFFGGMGKQAFQGSFEAHLANHVLAVACPAFYQFNAFAEST
ncbi:MAG: hypothetical protein ACD_39C02031G0002 [uncultured bacterium]|nr:MAG: hypothetical protein ACD_39C02031G0002 [uncultured bacterium]